MTANDVLKGQGFIRTKYGKPGISHNLIRRPRISEKLDLALKHKLTFVTASAGYGKSTAVLEWLEMKELPCAWLSLDDGDNDPVRFWRYIMAAVEAGGLVRTGNSFADILLNKELISSNILIDLLIDKLLTTAENIIFVLDDYHLIHNSVVQNSLEYFIKNVPQHIRIILLSREEPGPGLMGMYAKGQVLKLGNRDLSFNFNEIADFFKQRGYELSADEILSLESCTEGWVAGLVIAVLTMEEGFDSGMAASGFSGSNRHIGSFIRSEVFDRWPGEVKDFLVHTSFLGKLSQSLCCKVTGNAKSAELLEMLSATNSFVIPLDQENHWFRYHHLFQEFLVNRLKAESVTSQNRLYDLAGQWYLENGYIQDAINCFMSAGEYEKAFPLVWDIYLTMTQNGEYSTWRMWMERMPAELCESDVRACTGYSWVLSMENRLDEAELWADNALACYNRIKDGMDNREKEFLETNIALSYANTAVFRMDAAGAVRCFKRIREFNLYTPIIIGEMNSGEPNLLNTLYGFKGRLNKVEEAYSSVLGELPRFLGDFSAYIAVTLAECHYERGNLKAVYSTLVGNMGRITGLNNSGIIVPCFITLAKEKKANGDMKGAFEIIKSGRKILNGKNKELWSYFFDVFTASLYISAGDACNASKWLGTGRIGIFDNLSSSREFEYIVFSRLLILTKKLDEALLLLSRLEDFSRKEDRLKSLIEILCLTAIGYHLKEDDSNALPALHKAIELGSADGYMRTFADEAQPMADLLLKYNAWGKQTGNNNYIEYAKNLLKLTEAHIRTLSAAFRPLADIPSNDDSGEIFLSKREMEVLKLLVAGHSNQEISEELFISERTVKYHNAQIYEKMKVKNRLEAVIKVRDMRLIG